MSVAVRKAFEARRLSPVEPKWSFEALGDVQLQSAGASKLLADDGTAGEENSSQDSLECGAAARADRVGDVYEPAVFIGWRSILIGVRSIAASARWLDVWPNQSPEPTALLVTPRACARVAPSNAVAHL